MKAPEGAGWILNSIYVLLFPMVYKEVWLPLSCYDSSLASLVKRSRRRRLEDQIECEDRIDTFGGILRDIQKFTDRFSGSST